MIINKDTVLNYINEDSALRFIDDVIDKYDALNEETQKIVIDKFINWYSIFKEFYGTV